MLGSTLAITVFLTGACVVAVLIYIALLSRHRKAGTGEVNLVGAVARVERTLEPEGAVIVKGELWPARLKREGAPLLRGSSVRVVGARGHFLEVEPTE
ncbi:MAG: hypothetical protein H7Y30_15775 [Pyrinomonadaceae bacterium]|nr:hypothetical protein [Pyrinomonadaceae bacterium]